ncbi:hypothetical protein H4R34_000115 [Dimargaris verticillata]|uniref:HIT-type domain-containing protein n=1 Tax=Dimargaris verticillata TaxID=2761393 RepID=A0A9W8BE14_9FUNG|nr:hypothetical protein H4R34_000115 [Dimargaris verticillata]
MADAPDHPQPKRAKCQVCHVNDFKYKCPGCAAVTCSLACSQQHKAETGCTGQRSRTHYIPKKIYSESDMLSDFSFVQDVTRVADLANRQLQQQQQRPPRQSTALQAAARQRGVDLALMPAGMQRHDVNRTRFNHRTKAFLWTLEFHFYPTVSDLPTEPVIHLEHFVDDRYTWETVLQTFWTPSESSASSQKGRPTKRKAAEVEANRQVDAAHQAARAPIASNSSLRPLRSAMFAVLPEAVKETFASTPGDQLVLLMRFDGSPANHPQYYQLLPLQTIQESLAHKRVIEYPAIEVYSQPPKDRTLVDPEISFETTPAPNGKSEL